MPVAERVLNHELKEPSATSRPVPMRIAPVSAARRVLIVDDDPAILHRITEVLRSDPALFEPLGVESAEAALRILSAEDDISCLVTDFVLPGMDGLQLLLSARKLRPHLKVVVMTSEPTDDLHRAVLEGGAIQLLSKPLDFDDLLASISMDQQGSLSHLEGDLDLFDVCQLSAACQPDGGVRVRQGGSEGVLSHRGATLVHASVDGMAGAPAFASLRSWSHWHFVSLPALRAAHLPANCELETTPDDQRREGVRAAGSLRGLTLRHLIEWAMTGRQTCTLSVTSHRRNGNLSFEAGKIRGAETKDREGGLAAAEILTWENLRVELIRTPATAGGGLENLIDRFCREVEGFIATSVIRRQDGSMVDGRSADPRLDAAAAAGCYASVVDSHFAAMEKLGAGEAWGGTEDILITTANTYLLIRLLGDRHYHWLAVSSESNLALCRLLMRSYESALLSGLANLGEKAGPRRQA